MKESILIDTGYAVYRGENIELSYYNHSQRLVAEQNDKTLIYDIRSASDFAYVITMHDLENTDTARRFFNVCLNKFLAPLEDMEIAW